MTIPALPAIAQPDLEAWLIQAVGHIPGVTMFAYAANQIDRAGWLYAHSVQIDVRARRKAAARALAEQVRQLMIALPAQDWPEGHICYVQPIEGPFWSADADGGPRYCTRYEIRVHPRRATAAPPS